MNASQSPEDRQATIALLDETVRHLCSLGEKRSGSPEEAQACEYIAGKLRGFGLQPRVLAFDSYIGYPTRTEVHVVHPSTRAIDAVGVAFGGETPDGGIEAPIAFAGHGDEAGIRGLDVRGKIVLIDRMPTYGPAARALSLGAVGMLCMSSGPQRHKMTLSPVWGSPATPQELARMPRIPIGSINLPDGHALMDALREHGEVRVRLVARHDEGWRQVRLPVVEIAGSEPEFVLVGAHHCTWFDGSTDNLGSVALLLDVARRLAQRKERLRYSVRLAWWPGHTHGRYSGSAWYADNHWQDLHERCIAYFNIDGNGARGATVKSARNQMAEIGAFSAGLLRELYGEMPERERQALDRKWRRPEPGVDTSRPSRSSDQSFWGAGVSSLQIVSMLPADHPDSDLHISGSGGAWWWHTADETAEKVGLEDLADDAGIHHEAVRRLCGSDLLPLDAAAIAHDFRINLAQYEQAAGRLFPLRELIDAVDAFEAQAAALMAHGRELQAPARKAAFNRQLLRVIHRLNPVLYQRAIDQEHDPATGSRQLPCLAGLLELGRLEPGSDAARMLHVGMRRAANRVVHALREATDLARVPG